MTIKLSKLIAVLKLLFLVNSPLHAGEHNSSPSSFCREGSLEELERYKNEEQRQQIVFFASWCGSCRKHITESDPKQTIYVIAYDEPKVAGSVLQALKPQADLCLTDPKGLIREAFGVRSLPAKKLLSEQGTKP